MPLPPVVLTPSITNWVLVIASSQASHVSPLPAPPHKRGILSWGSRPSASLARMRRRRDSCSKGKAPPPAGQECQIHRGLGGQRRQPVRPGCRQEDHLVVGRFAPVGLWTRVSDQPLREATAQLR